MRKMLLVLTCCILLFCSCNDKDPYKSPELKTPALKYKEVKLHNSNSKIYSDKYNYLELTPDGNVYKYSLSSNSIESAKLLFSSPDIIDISYNNSIAVLHRNGRITLYDEKSKKLKEVGIVPNGNFLTHIKNTDTENYYVVTTQNDLYVKGSFSCDELGCTPINSNDKFVKINTDQKINKVLYNYKTYLLTQEGKVLADRTGENDFKIINFETKIIDFSDGDDNLISLGNDGNVYQYGRVNLELPNKEDHYLETLKVPYINNDAIAIAGYMNKEFALNRNGEVIFWGMLCLPGPGKANTYVFHTEKIKPFKSPELITTSKDVMFIRDNGKVYYVYVDAKVEK